MTTPFQGATGIEVLLIKRDFEEMRRGPSASDITIKYSIYAGNSPDVNRIHGHDQQTLNPTPIEVQDESTRAIVDIVSVLDVRILSFGIVDEGDAIIYFSVDLDLTMPNGTDPAVPGTVSFTDASGEAWYPKTMDLEELERYKMALIGNSQVSQPVICSRKPSAA